MSEAVGESHAMSRAILDIEISPMRPDELPFVAAGWKRSFRDAPQNEQVAEPAYYARMSRLFDQVLARRGVRLLVARDPERSSTLFGFGCFENRDEALALHYAYTRRSHRRLGVCRELLRRALQGADTQRLVYTAGTRFDHVWDGWGFERVDLIDWLRGEAA